MKLNGNNKNNKHVGSHVQNIPQPEPAPEKKSGGKRALRRGLVSIAVIALVVIGVIIGYSIWEAPPPVVGPGSQIGSSAGSAAQPQTSAPPAEDNNDSEPTPPSDPGATPPQEPVDEYEGALVTDRDDGVYTFLLVGRDHASNSTDTIIVGKFDTNTHTIDMVNIPRDTLINIDWCGSPKKINAIYPGFVNGGKPGIDGLLPEVSKILGFEVDFYAVVNLKVVMDVIDAIGGVDFDVPVDMHYDDYGQSFHVHLDKGYQHLNGYEALGVFRFRYGGYHNGVLTEGYPGGDVQRIETQQALLKAIAKQLLNLGNIPNLGTIIDLCIENVETTLNASNMAFFARQFLKCSMEDINFHEMPVGGFSMINGVSFVNISVDSWLELVNEKLNPYSKDVTTANVNILTANYEGTYLSATNGVIAGGWDSFYCQICSQANGWAPIWHVPGACPPAEGEGDGETGEGGTGGETGGEDPTDPETGETPTEPEPEVSPAPEGDAGSQ